MIHELSSDLVGFWKTQTIYAAVKLKIVDFLPDTLANIAAAINVNEKNCARFLRGLWELNIVKCLPNETWALTPKGELLKPTSSSSMAAAAEIWGESHYNQWQFLSQCLQENFKTQPDYFQSLAKNKDLLNVYQNSLSGYAAHDYEPVVNLHYWSEHKHIIDAGGGNGVLLKNIVEKYQNLKGTLIDLPEVIEQIPKKTKLLERIECKGFDFFKPWSVEADAILFTRVLHDWSDFLALKILNRAKEALISGGKIYIVEMLLNEKSADGGLLDLNMLVMTNGCERTLSNWHDLLEKASLKISEVKAISSVVSILVVEA